MRTTAAAVAICLLALAGPAATQAADPDTHFTVFVEGHYVAQGRSLSGQRTFTEFAEQGTIDTRTEVAKGPGFGGGVQYDFGESLGVAAFVTTVSRDADITYDARLPHPLYLNRPRSASGTASGSIKETAGHLDLVFHRNVGDRTGIRLYAGGSYWFDVSADLVSGVSYTHAYPYDTVTVTGAQVASSSGKGFGFNGGAGLEFRLTDAFGLGLDARYSQASIEVGDTSPVKIDVGGFVGALSLRLHF